MHVDAAPEAIRFVQEHGGKLYVWAKRARCCHGSLIYLEASTDPGDQPFTRIDIPGIELYFDTRLGEPEELLIEASGRRRKHVHAYWNGCAYIV